MAWKNGEKGRNGLSDKITIGSSNGAELDTTIYDQREVWENVTVEILTDSKTGKTSIGWYKQDNSRNITGEEYE